MVRISKANLKRLLLAGWTSQQIFDLVLFRDVVREKKEEEVTEILERLKFVKWLLDSGRLDGDS
jgi:hypothetical protein